MKRLWRYSRLGSVAVLASSPLLALAGCGSSDETPAPVVKVEPVVLTPAEKAWAEKAAANKAELLTLKQVQELGDYSIISTGEKAVGSFAIVDMRTTEPTKLIYFPLAFKLPSDVEYIGVFAFKKTALPDGFYLGPNVKTVGGGFYEFARAAPK